MRSGLAENRAPVPSAGRGCDDLVPAIVVVAVTLWSPLAALGLVPFVLWRLIVTCARERSVRPLRPRVWAPVLMVGLVVAAYLTLDAGRIPKGWTLGDRAPEPATSRKIYLARPSSSCLEAGLIGFAILAIRRSAPVARACVSRGVAAGPFRCRQ